MKSISFRLQKIGSFRAPPAEQSTSKRALKRVLKRDSSFKKAGLKPHQRRRALEDMKDIVQVSTVAQKAEEKRKRRSSQWSARSSSTSIGSSHSIERGTPETCPSTVSTRTIDEASLAEAGLKLPTMENIHDAVPEKTDLAPIIVMPISTVGFGATSTHKSMEKQGDDNDSSSTSTTASLMTHDNDAFIREYSRESCGSLPSAWDVEVAELEESTKELQERINMLQRSLEQTKQWEAIEVQQARAICSAKRKEAAAEELRKQYDATLTARADAPPASSNCSVELRRDRKEAMIDALREQNKALRNDSLGINLQLLSMLNSTARLQKATEQTREHVRELEEILIKPSRIENEKLLVDVGACLLERTTMEGKIQKAKDDADLERRTRRIYRQGVDRLLHMVQHRAWCDHLLLAAINEMINGEASRMTTEAIQEEKPKKTSFFGWW